MRDLARPGSSLRRSAAMTLALKPSCDCFRIRAVTCCASVPGIDVISSALSCTNCRTRTPTAPRISFCRRLKSWGDIHGSTRGLAPGPRIRHAEACHHLLCQRVPLPLAIAPESRARRRTAREPLDRHLWVPGEQLPNDFVIDVAYCRSKRSGSCQGEFFILSVLDSTNISFQKPQIRAGSAFRMCSLESPSPDGFWNIVAGAKLPAACAASVPH